MDWTRSFDWYVAGALSLGALAGGLAGLAWWVLGGVWILRRGWVRAALLLPYGLCWSLGVARQPRVVLLLFVAWLSVEAVVPWVRAARGKPGEAPDPVAAAAAAAGAVTSAAILWLGPLPDPSAILVSLLSGGLSALAFAVGAGVSAVVLWRRVLPSPVWRAAGGAALVLAFDGLGLTPGGLGVLFLGLPVLVHMNMGFAAALRRRWPASGRRLAAAAVWFLALAGLVAFSRFNVRLSERRSDEVITACRRFESEHGRLPSSLEDLVPAYLPSVPRASWAIRGFFRYTAGASPELSYFAPWPREVVYSFATGQRRTRPAGESATPGQAPESLRALEGVRSSVRLASLETITYERERPSALTSHVRVARAPSSPRIGGAGWPTRWPRSRVPQVRAGRDVLLPGVPGADAPRLRAVHGAGVAALPARSAEQTAVASTASSARVGCSGLSSSLALCWSRLPAHHRAVRDGAEASHGKAPRPQPILVAGDSFRRICTSTSRRVVHISPARCLLFTRMHASAACFHDKAVNRVTDEAGFLRCLGSLRRDVPLRPAGCHVRPEAAAGKGGRRRDA